MYYRKTEMPMDNPTDLNQFLEICLLNMRWYPPSTQEVYLGDLHFKEDVKYLVEALNDLFQNIKIETIYELPKDSFLQMQFKISTTWGLAELYLVSSLISCMMRGRLTENALEDFTWNGLEDFLHTFSGFRGTHNLCNFRINVEHLEFLDKNSCGTGRFDLRQTPLWGTIHSSLKKEKDA